MTIKKDIAIQSVQADFENLSNLVLEQLDMLNTILTSKKPGADEQMMEVLNKNEKMIDKKEVKLSEKIINSIVLYQPVASELRYLMATYRILISLERIGDHVINTANYVNKIKTPEVFTRLQEVINALTEHSIRMVRSSMLSFINSDREMAMWTLKNKSYLEEVNQKLQKKLISDSNNAETNKKLLLSVINIKEIMSNIERIADHATNIAEAAVYSFEGKELRHHKIND